MFTVSEMHGQRILLVHADGPSLGDIQDVLDLIGESIAESARMIAVPASLLDPEFFRLRSGFAGEVLQKIANYRLRLAVLGDISEWIERSTAFRDLVREMDRGTDVFFVADLDALSERLAAAVASMGEM